MTPVFKKPIDARLIELRADLLKQDRLDKLDYVLLTCEEAKELHGFTTEVIGFTSCYSQLPSVKVSGTEYWGMFMGMNIRVPLNWRTA